MEEPGLLSEHLLSLKEQHFRAYKIGWGPFGRVSDKVDEAIVKAAREAVGDEALLAGRRRGE
jgi:D-galactarolactone cycloisomerase